LSRGTISVGETLGSRVNQQAQPRLHGGKSMQALSVSGGLDMNMTIEQIDEQIKAFTDKIRARGEARASAFPKA
jgi:glycine cleavage system regulatory protein